MSSFRILGPVEASIGGRRLSLGGSRQVKLFSFLLVHANQAVSRDAVTEAVWGPARARSDNRLQMAIARLRKALGPLTDETGMRLRTVSGGYMLTVGAGELDAEVFARMVEDGQRALDAADPAAASELLSAALGLWRGPPLADVAFEDFARSEIRCLEELRLGALEARNDAELQLGRHVRLVAELEGLVAAEPTRERLVGQLMLALYRSGRQADALAVYQRARTRLAEELGLEPGPALRALQVEVLEQAEGLEPGIVASDAPMWSAKAPLPAAATSTIGRELEIDAISSLLCRSDVRLVTLVGPGGVGKTRLAMAVGRAAEWQFSSRACWVELAGVARATDVGFSIAQAVGVTPLEGEGVSDALVRTIATRQLLLVVDNFEHVLDAAGLIGSLVAACHGLTVLATSREALRLAAEQRFVVEPLGVPDAPESATLSDLERFGATAMFIAAANRHDNRFQARPEAASAVARLCTRLDGLPLAIELAAAQTELFGVDELAVRLDRKLGVLEGGPRDAPARQQTLRATIEWSYRLLDDAQRTAFARYSVFAGGSTLDAAVEVADATLPTINGLIEKSLLYWRTGADGSRRLMMLETVREYALGRLAEDPRQKELHRRHLEHYLRVVVDCVPQLLRTKEDKPLALLDREIDNIRASLLWALAKAPALAVRLAGLLHEYWLIRQDPDALGWVDAALAADGDGAPLKDRAHAQLGRSSLLWERPEAHAQAAKLALELYRELDDQEGIAMSLISLAACTRRLNDPKNERVYAEEACRHARLAEDDATLGLALANLGSAVSAGERLQVLEEARELLEPMGSYRHIARAYGNASYAAILEDRPTEALELLAVAMSAAEELGDIGIRAYLCGNLGLAHLFTGAATQAQEEFTQELVLGAQQSLGFGTDEALAGLAAVAAANGFDERAATLSGAAKALGNWRAFDRPILDRLEHSYFAPARSRLGATAWHHAEQTGAEMSYAEAVQYATGQPADAGRPAADRTVLVRPLSVPE